MSDFRRWIINSVQRYNRRLNTAYLENMYQISYLDLARRTSWLTDVPLSSPSGGTASFSLLYIMLSILSEKAVSRPMEIGVGQSTRLLVQYARAFAKQLTLLDDDEFWLRQFTADDEGITALHAQLVPTVVGTRTIDWYDCDQPSEKFDFLLIDGPMAFARGMRYNRLGILKWLPDIMEPEFVMIVDDSTRPAEQLLIKHNLSALETHGVAAQTREIISSNSQTIIATQGSASISIFESEKMGWGELSNRSAEPVLCVDDPLHATRPRFLGFE